MDYDSLLELVKKRRSIRRFKPDPVPDEYIEKIIEVARWAPSGFNMQPWEFVVVKKPELRNKIVEYISTYWDQGKIMESTREAWQGRPWRMKGVVDSGMDYTTAPVFILLFGDTRTKDGLPMGVRYSQERFQLIFVSSLANAFIYMHLAATTLGLASQWVSAVTTPFAHCMIKDLLGIPGEMVPYDMMALGYPGSRPGEKYLRDPGKMVHYDKCGVEDFRSDEEVRDFIRRARSWTIGSHHKKGDPT
ncbi:MAG: nitroreductase family protein [Deltaproteobacteria bacterium]|nr:nitroreductase family protein [Deltaproteobacteria bacterium]